MKKTRGFTIVELLVVIAAVSLVSSFVLVSVRGSRERAQIARTNRFSFSVYHSQGAFNILEARFEGNLDISGEGITARYLGVGDPVFGKGFSGGQSISLEGDSWVEIIDEGGGPDRSVNLMKRVAEKNAVTIEGWVKPNTVSDDWTLVGSFETFQLWYSGEEKRVKFKIAKYLEGSYTISSPPNLLSPERWCHLMGVYDGGSISLYINTEKVASQEGLGIQLASMPGGSCPVRIGSSVALGLSGMCSVSSRFSGNIDNVRIYASGLD